MTSSTIILKEEFVTRELKSYLTEQVQEYAKKFDGRCKLVDASREYHFCRVQPMGAGVGIGVGFNARGKYMIALSSTVVHVFPPTRKRVLTGKHLSELYTETEDWMIALVSAKSIQSAERRYNAYNASEPLR